MTTAAAPFPSRKLPGRKPKAPAILYGAILLTLLILLSVFALTARQPPPPTIAEFAPQAVEQIQDAPSEQSSEFGSGEGPGDCPPGAACGEGGSGPGGPGGGEPPPIKGVPRARKCIGDPPRQIEDPQSPPCVPFWSGDNGGSTAKGVTENEIRIGIPDSGDEDKFYVAFFNSRFEFYGRKLVPISLRDDFAGGEPVQQRNAAVAAEAKNIFASTNATYGGGFHYYDELANRGIISGVVDSTVTEDYLKERHPYIWQYEPAIDRMLSSLGDWACARLGGQSARHAGDPLMHDDKRVFGIMFGTQSPDVPVDPNLLKAELESCGHEVPIMRQYVQGTGAGSGDDAGTMIAMNDAGVTTIFCLSFFVSCSRLGQAASGQAYFPEWVLSTYYRNDRNFGIKNFNFPREQLDNAFGLTFLPRQLDGNYEPEYWALREVNPGDSGEGSRSGLRIWNVNVKYRSLLLLASGIQMAGPELTPQTFAAALARTKFPNPDHKNLPGRVGFNDGDHGMMNDMAEIWWSNDAQSPYPEEERGSWCYVEGGARRARGAFPRGDSVFFSGECVTGANG
ncbi:MAG TPA: hypothetical protein VND22_02155 [Actinomycetota bacterium]|nr:hypothetical protein [Actinomycetota bacterium]